MSARVMGRVAVVAALAAGPAAGQADMTCGDFLALDDGARMEAMLTLRAVLSGDTIPKGEEVADATVLTGATEAGAAGGVEVEAPTTPNVPGSPEAMQRLRGMVTSCTGMADIPAADALIAAHADYDPVLDEAAAD